MASIIVGYYKFAYLCGNASDFQFQIWNAILHRYDILFALTDRAAETALSTPKLCWLTPANIAVCLLIPLRHWRSFIHLTLSLYQYASDPPQVRTGAMLILEKLRIIYSDTNTH
jgi:hypothetical protein